jgi:signal peptidase
MTPAATDMLTTPAPMLRSAKPRRLGRVGRKAGNILGTLVAVIVVMVAAVVIILAVATRLSSKQGQYTAFGHPILTVLSGSMAPTIKTGDVIVDNGLTATQANQLHVGQIISFREQTGSSTFETHRIVSVVHQGSQVLYETKGDANNAPDGSLRPASNVVGVYATSIPRAGYFLSNLHKPLVLGLLLAAPLLWLIAEPLRRKARAQDELTKDPSISGGTPGEDTL